MKIIILNKAWNLCFRKISDQKTEGFCDAPDTPNKQIVIDKRLQGIAELDAILHELEHAADWQKSEEIVDQKMTDIAAILWRLGYRKLSKSELKDFDSKQN